MERWADSKIGVDRPRVFLPLTDREKDRERKIDGDRSARSLSPIHEIAINDYVCA